MSEVPISICLVFFGGFLWFRILLLFLYPNRFPSPNCANDIAFSPSPLTLITIPERASQKCWTFPRRRRHIPQLIAVVVAVAVAFLSISFSLCLYLYKCDSFGPLWSRNADTDLPQDKLAVHYRQGYCEGSTIGNLWRYINFYKHGKKDSTPICEKRQFKSCMGLFLDL